MLINVDNKVIGKGNPVFFIAEAGVNHNGSIDLAKQLIDIAVDAGADAVKFQTFKAGELNTETAPKSSYHIQTTGSDKDQTWFELLKSQEISYDMHVELIKYCKKKDIIFLSTPYGFDSADLLEGLDIAMYKLASTDLNNLPLISHVAKKGRPIIISTAMSNFDEVKDAYQTIKKAGLDEIVILQCTGNYPSELSDSNLNVMKTYKNEFKCLVGYSDHTLELINPIAATAMGANVYEKHFTIDKNLPGPDHRMSLDPMELKRTIRAIRETELAMGSLKKDVLADEKENRIKLRKSIVAIVDIEEGQIITKEMLAIKRPGNGIAPKEMQNILGKRTRIFIAKDSVISKTQIL